MRNSKDATATYQPKVYGDVPPATFAERMAVCDTCPQRRFNRCDVAKQMVTILARNGKQQCYRWPGDQSATIDLPSESAEESPQQHRVIQQPEKKNIGRMVVVTSYFNP